MWFDIFEELIEAAAEGVPWWLILIILVIVVGCIWYFSSGDAEVGAMLSRAVTYVAAFCCRSGHGRVDVQAEMA